MADFYDNASNVENLYRNHALARRMPEAPKTTGACLYCNEKITGRRWCNVFCRDDYEKGLNRQQHQVID